MRPSFEYHCTEGIDDAVGILVRDDDAKEKLLAQIGKIGIVLLVVFHLCYPVLVKLHGSRTIYDSKGLEFNDVRKTLSDIF